MLKLLYDKGTLLIKGDYRLPQATWDESVSAYRALAMSYPDLLTYLDRSRIEYEDRVLSPVPCPHLSCEVELRDYQADALDAWRAAGRRGAIALPTGAGKTMVALKAIEDVDGPTLVVVPTLDLLEQWRRIVEEKFGVEVGVFGGGDTNLGPITVSTYDSAYIRGDYLGDKFDLIVFDEVHHLPSPGYSHIAEMSAAPCRLGLTATYEREDGAHEDLNRLIGGKVFELRVDDLTGSHLSTYELQKIPVDLTPEEQVEYDRLQEIFTNYLSRHNIVLRSPSDFQKVVYRSGWDRGAREALLARNEARRIALGSETKLDTLADILNRHAGERTIVFTQHNELVHRISHRFLLPSITHRTPARERAEVLDRFRDGAYNIVVTSKVLDEGIDVPEASVAVILSGTGSSREFIQRLGRILRKREGKRAILYEIISRGTSETTASWRRKSKLRGDQ